MIVETGTLSNPMCSKSCRSDEDGLYCDENSFQQTNLELPDQPFGMFEPPGMGLLLWQTGSGETGNKGTGPAFDHTIGDSTGHYLFIDSSQDTVADTVRAELVSKPLKAGQGTDNNCEIVFYYHMYGRNVGDLTVEVAATEGGETPKLVWQTDGDQGNMWHRQYLVVENATEHSEYVVLLTGNIREKGGGDIAIDDITFNYNCLFEGSGTTAAPTEKPSNLENCDFEQNDCNWAIDSELNTTEAFSFRRTNGDAHADTGNGPSMDHDGHAEKFFLWADAREGTPNSFTSISSPVVSPFEKICFEFFFDLSHADGIAQLQVAVEEETQETPTVVWDYAEHAEFWMKGRVKVEQLQNFKIIVTAVRGEQQVGYVAVDDFRYKSLERFPYNCFTLHFSVSQLILRIPAQRYQKRLFPVQPRNQHHPHLRLLIHSFVTATSTTTCAVGSLTTTVGHSGGSESQLIVVRVLDIIAQLMIVMVLFYMSVLKKEEMLEIVQLYPLTWVQKAKGAWISTSTYTMRVASGH